MRENKENIILKYSGKLDYDIINELLEDLNNRLEKTDLSTLVRKRIYSTAVETLENIMRHAPKKKENNKLPQFCIKDNKDGIIVESCNVVSKKQQSILKERIDYINDNSKNLKKIFAEKLKNSNISVEGGAGLGVFIIGKNACEKISYSFQNLNKEESYFCLKIKI
jgi:hypothetical protein